MLRKFSFIVVTLILTATLGAQTSAPALSREDRAKLEKLKATVLGQDRDAAFAALREIEAMGAPAQRDLLGLLRQALAANKSRLEMTANSIGDVDKFAAIEKDLAEQRKAALDNIAALDKKKPETLQKARDFYESLRPNATKINTANNLRLVLIDGWSTRNALIEIFNRIKPADDPALADDEKLKVTSEKVLGLSLADAAAIPALSDKAKVADGPARTLYNARLRNQILAYNKTCEAFMSPGELENFNRVNDYRDVLGLLPFEADPRLTQSARRHSKEMLELKYFSHDSPTAGLKSHTDRMKAAGYSNGYSENIAMGARTGEAAFVMWFDSPGHHKNMAGPGLALGVGKWGVYWTQNMGRGDRLSLKPKDELKTLKVPGENVPPG